MTPRQKPIGGREADSSDSGRSDEYPRGEYSHLVSRSREPPVAAGGEPRICHGDARLRNHHREAVEALTGLQCPPSSGPAGGGAMSWADVAVSAGALVPFISEC
jgi:hypothetical protein